MSQIILIFVKLNNKQRFINGLTHCNEPVAGGASRVVFFSISQKNCFSKPKLALAGPDDSNQPHWVFRLNLFMTVIKLQLWPQAARPIFQSKNYKNVGGRFFLSVMRNSHRHDFEFFFVSSPRPEWFRWKLCDRSRINRKSDSQLGFCATHLTPPETKPSIKRDDLYKRNYVKHKQFSVEMLPSHSQSQKKRRNLGMEHLPDLALWCL